MGSVHLKILVESQDAIVYEMQTGGFFIGVLR